jgi:hypothetical protein
MISKPGHPVNEETSYRPISLLPVLLKLFEKLFLNRHRNDIELQDPIPDYQFGSRENHSTIQQTHRIVNKIAVSLKKKQFFTAVFLDIAHAFNKLWHSGLLYKIRSKLPSPYCLLLKLYISER